MLSDEDAMVSDLFTSNTLIVFYSCVLKFIT